jgi:hypothetical protein
MREKIQGSFWHIPVLAALMLSPFFNSINSLLTIVIGLICIWLMPKSGKPSIYFIGGLLVYLSLILVSMWSSSDTTAAGDNAVFFISWPIYIGYAQLKKDKLNLSLISKWFSIAMIIGFVAFLVHASYMCIHTGDWRSFEIDGRPNGTWFTYANLTWDGHPWYFGLAVGLALILELYFNESPKNWRVYVLQFSLVMAMGRINILAMLAVYAICFLFDAAKRPQIIRQAISYVLLLVLIIGMNKMLVNDRFTEKMSAGKSLELPIKGEDGKIQYVAVPGGAQIRASEWGCAWTLIKANPWIGLGNDNSQRELHQCYKETGFTYGFLNKYNCHNQYIEFALRFGIIWTAMLFTGILYVIVQLYRKKNYAFVLGWIYILICLLTESGMVRQAGSNLIGLWALLSITFILSSSEQEASV